VSTFREPRVKPSVLPRAPAHKNDPRKGEFIVFVSEHDELYYGRILWVNRSDDQCGILLLKDREYESFDLSMLESTGDFGRSVRWKITL
jgi:hypothetical protein